MQTTIIAYLGKGGTGKTILSSVTGKIALEKGKKVLFIDADPAMGLATALGCDGYKTIGEAREQIIRQAKLANDSGSTDGIGDIVDYLLLETLHEAQGFSMLVMGQTNTLGCYCPVNNLLRETIKAVASNYDVVIIDAEAGIEQISRQVTECVHYPILVTDNSVRGVKTTIMALETITNSPTMQPLKTGVIFNRVSHADDDLVEYVKKAGLLYYGSIPVDEDISDIDRKGMPSLGLCKNAVSVTALRYMLENEGIIL